jgi:3',5'-cyclic AMP phosphodiesterase CpdA
MKICIISDLHCKLKQEPEEKSETFLFSNSPRKPVNQHPVVSLLHLIERDNLSADVLLCPGDLGDRADEQGITSSWQFLQEIKSKLSASLLIGLPGNHDINSRQLNKKEPFEFIKNFHEEFPVSNDDLKANFWQNGFCFLKHNDGLFLLFNSVMDHSDSTKANQSNIKPETLEHIRNIFESNSEYRSCSFKIATLHHHPIHHSNIKNWRDTDMVNNGDKLIALLNELGFQILIHGHKHQPRLIEINSFPVFATGSFACFANLQGTGINTMFHVLQLNANSRKGNIYSWEFDFVKGWTHKLNEIFPPKVGFGSNRTVDELATAIHNLFIQNAKKPMLFDEILAHEDDLKYTVPEKLISLKKQLLTNYNIITTPEFPIEPIKISQLLTE